MDVTKYSFRRFSQVFFNSAHRKCCACSIFLCTEKGIYTAVFTFSVILFIVATVSGNFVSYPIIFFGLVTFSFAYKSYKFSKEKFRLDLWEKREPSFIAMKRFSAALLENIIHPLPEIDQQPLDDWHYTANTKAIEKAKSALRDIKSNPEDGKSALIEDIWILYGADIKSILQESEVALLHLEQNWPQSSPAYLEEKTIKENINPHLIALSQGGNNLSKALIKYMEFGEYSK